MLPVELTHFIGRERELLALRRLAADARLLTLTGAGGSGKSRLALELVPDLLQLTPDGVAWVELAPLMEERLLPEAVLRALGTTTEGVASAQSVVAAVRDRALTLVLDNCEHLVDACAFLADALLRASPRLRILATSREALGVAGERAWLVPPLSIPDADAELAVLAGADAVRLFLDRARDVVPEFELGEGNTRVVADICRRLDGIPLAIELAAARVRHMTPEQIRERLSDAFALLTTGSRTALPRHRTLRATLDWSHELLREEGRTVLRRLSVFRGGFTLELAEQVASGDGIPAGDVIDLIALLADRSLLVVREQRGVARYHLLETMRQYAAQKLEESGEAERVRGRLAAAVVALVAELAPSFTTTARREAFAQLEPELDNIREVLAWTARHEPQLHVRVVGLLWWFWFSTRHWVEAHRWINGALTLPAAAARSGERAALLFAAGALDALRGDAVAARPRLEEAIALATELPDPQLEAYALNYLAMTYASSLSPEGRPYAARAEAWFRAAGDAYGLRLALLLGGMLERSAGNIDVAIAMMEEAVRIARGFGQDRELAIALQTFASTLMGSGQLERSRRLMRESLEALRRDPSVLFAARGLDYHAAACAEQSPHLAARALGMADGARRNIGAQRFDHDERYMAGVARQLRDALGDAGFESAHEAGMQVPIADALDEVLATPPPGADAVTPATTAGETLQPMPPDTAPADLEVRALGPLEVRVHGTPIESWPYAKPRELLIFLLLYPLGRTRTEISDALWPDATPAQVRNNFHVTMHHLRRTLGHADWVLLEGDRYRLAPTLTVAFDALEFERQVHAALLLEAELAPAALRAAMALYRDHFLAGDTASAWRDEVQDRMRRLFCDAGLRLGTLLEHAADPAGAVAVWERVVACEPLHEQAHRGLLRGLALTGNRAHALRHYERLSALLEELELEPEPETAELHERIRRAEPLPAE